MDILLYRWKVLGFGFVFRVVSVFGLVIGIRFLCVGRRIGFCW